MSFPYLKNDTLTKRSINWTVSLKRPKGMSDDEWFDAVSYLQDRLVEHLDAMDVFDAYAHGYCE